MFTDTIFWADDNKEEMRALPFGSTEVNPLGHKEERQRCRLQPRNFAVRDSNIRSDGSAA